ncbi:hypothetical protein NDU88_004300 [Pleurodeles waltl]|uniref:Uncharacterized protein n=1 Tax=Pleurodeles waltl TaxID=8319 RepID=A0AAV7VIB9_PLEWA|nr:hypothetical protein NDU88_004300 [Pleurodeles waltl]
MSAARRLRPLRQPRCVRGSSGAPPAPPPPPRGPPPCGARLSGSHHGSRPDHAPCVMFNKSGPKHAYILKQMYECTLEFWKSNQGELNHP